jgi:DtxR family Mn-dependent transcriptional regulator
MHGKRSLPKKEESRRQMCKRHWLWKTFLYKKLEFTWNEVHEVAEQLQQIQSEKPVDKLDKFLKYPEFDPHGGTIPNAKGVMKAPFKKTKFCR